MRIQLQKIQEAMGKIRRNALNYFSKGLRGNPSENLDTISDTKENFRKYRELVRSRVKETGRREHQCTPSQVKKKIENLEKSPYY